jgi:hypothetical protein
VHNGSPKNAERVSLIFPCWRNPAVVMQGTIDACFQIACHRRSLFGAPMCAFRVMRPGRDADLTGAVLLGSDFVRGGVHIGVDRDGDPGAVTAPLTLASVRGDLGSIIPAIVSIEPPPISCAAWVGRNVPLGYEVRDRKWW